MGMSQLRWIDKTQPQTLMMATVILYINAVLGLLDGMILGLGAVLVLGQAVAGLGVANEKKWGYWLAVGLVVLWLGFILWDLSFIASFGGIVNLLFYGALLALLLHRQSREYRRVWFRW
jgi:hypothetical protein